LRDTDANDVSSLPQISHPLPAQSGGAVVRLHPEVGTEHEFVEALRARQPWAVGRLIERYSAIVRRSLYRVLGTTVDLDDLEQDTFVTVLARCHTLRDPDALRSFIVSVAMRLARNELRKRAIRRFVGLDVLDNIGVPAHDPAAAQCARRVYAALDQLDPGVRIAFVLRHVEGCELTETAAACGCSLATVKRWLARAEEKLRAFALQDDVLRSLIDNQEGAV
jgi:RNA polymerase sigma-70 factor (ECF subfamily)